MSSLRSNSDRGPSLATASSNASSAGVAESTTCGSPRSQPSRLPRSSRTAAGPPRASCSKKSLIRFRSVSRSISSIRLIAIAVWFGDRTREIDLRGSVGPEQPDQLLAGDERQGERRPPPARRELRPQPGELDRRAGGRRGRRAQAQLLCSGHDQVQGAAPGAEQVARPRHDRGRKLVDGLGPRQLLAERRQVLELAHAAARLLVEPCVLDRARHERRARDEKRNLAVGELARRLGVQGDHPDHAAVPGRNRHRDERLKPLLVELGHVLEAWVVRGAVTDEGRRAVLHRPPREAFPALEDDCSGEMLVGRRGRVQDEPVALEQVDEAGMDGARLREQPDDASSTGPISSDEPTVEMIRYRNVVSTTTGSIPIERGYGSGRGTGPATARRRPRSLRRSRSVPPLRARASRSFAHA